MTAGGAKFFSRTLMLAFVVFLNGMAVMILEMAGARLLAPDLGSSVVVWTSLIGIILASLSLGYWLGGRLADKRLSAGGASPAQNADQAFALLSTLLVAASVVVFMVALLGGQISHFLSRSIPSLHLATVVTALALFSLPGVLCGMVSPYAVRLAITGSETSGAVIGRLNAVSTIGSIVGTFLGGFVLLSFFSTMSIFIGVAGCLLAAAALVRLRPLLPKAVLALLFALGISANIAYELWNADTALAEGRFVNIETSYSSMRVGMGMQEGRAMRMLFTDPGSSQSAMYEDAPNELAFAYTRFYALGAYMNKDAKRILMLGGGGYSVPKWLLSGASDLTGDFSLDVVELDPGMTRTAARYFAAPLGDSRMRVFHEDARTYVNRVSGELAEGEPGFYDLVFADIFNSWYTVPFHVGTVEAARNIKKILSPGGIYIMNIITAINGDNGRLLRSIRNAFALEFENVHVFPVQSRHNGNIVQNVMLVAFDGRRSLPDPENEKVAPHIARILANRWNSFPDPENDVPALQDSLAPVERYTLGFHE